MQFQSPEDTIVAIATPQGMGALGIIRLSGREAISLASVFFYGKIKPEQAAPNKVHFGRFMIGQEMLDEVLLTVFRAPHSFTGEDSVEISFHGSVYILQRSLEAFVHAGARLAGPGEFTQRAYLNGKMDLSQAEAVADVIASESEAAHRLAIDQMKGGFSAEIRDLRERLIHFASLIELELDFGEEDVEFANREELKKLVVEILQKVSGLAQSFRLGNVIKKGVHTVLAGRPNAGKSTLLNALLDEERAIVSDIPGTTRDTIEETLNIHGVLFRLTDTAGIREATDAIEKIGVEKTLQEISKGALLVYIYDAASTTRQEVENDLSALVHAKTEVLVVANKRDKVEGLHDHIIRQVEDSIPADHVYISAKNKLDIELLRNRIFETIAGKVLAEQQVVVTNVRHYEALKATELLLAKVMQEMDTYISGDLLAMDIRQALYHLGSIIGEVTADDLLGSIFSKFCIGK